MYEIFYFQYVSGFDIIIRCRLEWIYYKELSKNDLEFFYYTCTLGSDEMNKYIVLLRGINVSGHKPVKMDSLSKMMQDLNFKKVKTYIQSGNVVFETDEENTYKLEKRISDRILKIFGFVVPVLVLDLDEMLEINKNNPFIQKRKEDTSKLYVTFLSAAPSPSVVAEINKINYKPDEFVFKGRAVYLFCPGSYGNTKLNNNFFENKLKLPATTRNWKTIGALISLHES